MALLSALRPRRRFAFPFVVVLAPLLWALLLEADFDAAAGWANMLRAALTVTAVVLSYVAAAISVTVFETTDVAVPDWGKALFTPSTGTLLLFATITVALSLYIVEVPVYPDWIEPVARLIGILIGWPLYAAILAMYFVINTLPGQVPTVVQYLFFGGGVTLSTAWTFFLCSWLANLTVPIIPRPTVR